MNLQKTSEAVFRGERIKTVLSGYTLRSSQIEMASAVSDLIELGGTAVLEAGTGVGKSLAYLVPAVLSGQAAVISTATITLQDQLLHKDIPAVGAILDREIDAAVLKGRSNYLCLRKWSLWGDRAAPELSRWVSSGVGDISSLPASMDAGVLRKVTGDSLDCLGSQCPDMHRCHYYRARNRARKASILIVNHHLLLCGIETGDLIPEAWLLVADEAHALHQAASSTLGFIIGEGLLNPVFDAVVLSGMDPPEKAELLAAARNVSTLIAELVSAGNENGEVEFQGIPPMLQAIADSAGELRKRMEGGEELAGACHALSGLERTALSMAQTDRSTWCCYTAKSGRHTVMRSVPVNPGPLLRDALYGVFPAVLLTSATLASGSSFSYSDSLLGVPDGAERRIFESPFDYPAQSVLALPDLPLHHEDHAALANEAWATAREAALILGGRTMVLFTSYRNMELCFQAATANPAPGLELLVQGKMSRSAILEAFRADPRAIILGTASFWEGIDLPGELLQALVIDRIPFPSPGHPLTRARMNHSEETGVSSFSSIMLPEAATRLKQGAGRLIRSSVDTGAVFILDRRMRTAGYAGVLLRSMPPFRRTTFGEAMDFLREQAASSGGINGEGRTQCGSDQPG